MQVCDVPTEGLFSPEGAPQGILILTDYESALAVDGLGGSQPCSTQTAGRRPPFAIGVDGPGPIFQLPGHTEVMPLSVSTEHRQVWGMVPVDNESKSDKAFLIDKATELEFINKSWHGIGEDGGDLLGPGVPLEVGTGCDSRQFWEVRKHLHVFCVCFVFEHQDWYNMVP